MMRMIMKGLLIKRTVTCIILQAYSIEKPLKATYLLIEVIFHNFASVITPLVHPIYHVINYKVDINNSLCQLFALSEIVCQLINICLGGVVTAKVLLYSAVERVNNAVFILFCLFNEIIKIIEHNFLSSKRCY